jgi:heme exporter protein D
LLLYSVFHQLTVLLEQSCVHQLVLRGVLSQQQQQQQQRQQQRQWLEQPLCVQQ